MNSHANPERQAIRIPNTNIKQSLMSKCWGLDPSSRGSDIEESLARAWLWWTSAGLEEKETTCKGKKNLCFAQSVLTLRGPSWPQREKVMSAPPCCSRILSTVLQHSRLNHQVEMRTQRRNFLFFGGSGSGRRRRGLYCKGRLERYCFILDSVTYRPQVPL